MKISKAYNRDRKYRKARYGMQISGKSVFVIREVINKKAEAIQAKKELAE